MNTPSFTATRTWAKGLAMIALAAGGWALAGSAQARDVYWSIGVNSPGVAVGVSNAPPPVVYSYPSYGYPVYEPRPVVVYPRPVVVQSYPVYPAPYYGYRDDRRWHKHRHGHRHGHRGWDD